jgi:pectate lyase
MTFWRVARIAAGVGLTVMLAAYVLGPPNVQTLISSEPPLWKLASVERPRGTEMAVLVVASTSELQSALKAAQGGDTIELAPGTYTGLRFNGINLKFDQLVTLTSADPTKPAVINDFAITGATNLRFANLTLATLDQPDKVAAGPWAFSVTRSDSIFFDHVKVHGTLDGDASNDVRGLSIRESSNVSVTNSEFQQLDRALAIGQSQNVIVAFNTAHHLRSDGFNFAEVKNVSVKSNTLHTFNPVKDDHPDAIQFWTSGTKTPSTDIEVTGNIILKGGGGGTQGIFFRDQIGTLPFERVNIADNLIIGTGYNGIRVMGATDIKILRNELISFEGETKTFLLVQKADGVTAVDNKAVSISFDTSTNVSQSGSKTNSPVSDAGALALRKWVEAHPDAAARLSWMQISWDLTGDTGQVGPIQGFELELQFDFNDLGFLFA